MAKARKSRRASDRAVSESRAAAALTVSVALAALAVAAGWKVVGSDGRIRLRGLATDAGLGKTQCGA